jgi:hypothetical protein
MVGLEWQGLGTAEDRYLELSRAIDELSDRCLQQSVRWAAEMLVGLPEEVMEPAASKAAADKAKRIHPEHPAFILARSYFEQKVRGSRVRLAAGAVASSLLLLTADTGSLTHWYSLAAAALLGLMYSTAQPQERAVCSACCV